MQVLVTGGGGFLGSRIVHLLRREGHAVRVFSRQAYPELVRVGVECLTGDLRDPIAVAAACQGCELVFHTAAKAGVWGSASEYYAINVSGTENVLAACRQHRVSRLVYTSSPSVVFGRMPIINGDESLPYPEQYLATYPRTKAAAEKLVLIANGTPLPGTNPDGTAKSLLTCAIRPHLIWGPGDPHLIPRLIQAAKAGRLQQVGDGANMVDITYVDNAALAHLQAARHLGLHSPVAGRAYFIGDAAPVNLWNWIAELFRRLEVPPVRKTMSFRRAYLAGGVLEHCYRLMPLPGEPPMTRFVALQLALSHYFSHARAERDFDYHPEVDNETGLQQLTNWLK